MSERQELVLLATSGGVSIAELARRFGVSRKTVYKWLGRHRLEGSVGLADRSRRPHGCPHRTGEQTERAVLALRDAHPAWGPRKLHHRLRALGVAAPAPSTISRVLRDHGRIDPDRGERREPWRRFERPCPNDLWQMDFKSPVRLADGGACHPLTVLDDHSRYALELTACVDQTRQTVRWRLTEVFGRYGLPWAMLTDNGSPWRSPRMDGSFTRLEVWLMRLGIRVLHGRPFHPQTQGKDERFHRTIQAELLQCRAFADLASVQAAFEPWRSIYNHQRPHEALGMATPAQRYRPSRRSMPRILPAIEYGPGDHVRRVDCSGLFRFQRRRLRAGKAFAGESVALRPTRIDGVWAVRFARLPIGHIDLTKTPPDGFAHVLGVGSGRSAPSANAEHDPSL